MSGETETMSPDALIDVMLALDPMADLPRTGWVQHGIAGPESLAAHSHGVALVTMWLIDMVRAGDPAMAVDGEKALRMALLHDAAEAVTGDVPMPQKTAEMNAALHALESSIAEDMLPAPAFAVWTEAERGDSIEARIVRAADKVQMMVKVLVYEQKRAARLDEFWTHAGNFRVAGVEPARAVYERIAARAGRTIPGFS